MKRQDWIGKRNRKLALREKAAQPMVRLTIAQLETKIAALNVRCTNGADKILFMKMTGDPRYNVANALLGQLQAERRELERQLESAIAWQEGGWEEMENVG